MGRRRLYRQAFLPAPSDCPIRAILRRQQLARGDPSRNNGEPEPPLIERGRLVMDPARHQVSWMGREVGLTVTSS